MVGWCQENLAPRAPGFTFHHHDVFYEAFNAGPDKPLWRPFPFGDVEFTLVIALSVFTHLTEDQSEQYLAEVARVLAPDGPFVSTFFVFDKRDFPMIQEEQNTLFINPLDVRNVVIYDRAWLSRAAGAVGLTICTATPPQVRGFHWTIYMKPTHPGVHAVEVSEEIGDRGHRRPPAMPAGAERIGL
jgi:SAM-dependent methyltransferase